MQHDLSYLPFVDPVGLPTAEAVAPIQTGWWWWLLLLFCGLGEKISCKFQEHGYHEKSYS